MSEVGWVASGKFPKCSHHRAAVPRAVSTTLDEAETTIHTRHASERRVVMELGRLGVWVGMDGMSAAAAASFTERVEDRGYGALWIPEGRGRNALVLSSWLLCHTKRLIVATGIANIYARDPVPTAGGQPALAAQSDGRVVLGVGVSRRLTVEGGRGHTDGKPVPTMRAYLQGGREAPYG